MCSLDVAPAPRTRCCFAGLPLRGQGLVNCGFAGIGASLIYTIRLTEMMEEYKKKVKENGIIFEAIREMKTGQFCFPLPSPTGEKP